MNGIHLRRGLRSIVHGLSAALVAATAALHAPPAAAMLNAAEDPSSVANDAVVRILSGGMMCTGVLVAPDLVLTAGHCFEGAVQGHVGPWSSRAPMWRNFFLPMSLAAPLAGWSSGLRDGPILANQIIAPFNYTSFPSATANTCRSACQSDSTCAAFAFSHSDTMCYLKRARAFVFVGGNRTDTSTLTIEASEYSFPGPADIGLLRLSSPVPATVAKPAAVMSHLPAGVAGIDAFLRPQSFEAVGFTPINPSITRRQRAAMAFAAYPNGTDIAQFHVSNPAGAVLQGGDSGSPLFMLRRMADGSTQRIVVGIAQGPTGASWNRYTLTGINVARTGVPVVFPYADSSIDGASGVLVGEWLNNVMLANHRARQATTPLYNWWSARYGDNFATTDPRWASDPSGLVKEPTGLYIDPPRLQDGYAMYRLEGHVFDPKQPRPAGTVPLWSWFGAAGADNFITTQSGWSTDPAAVVWDGEHIVGGRVQSGYRQYRLEGYIFDPDLPQPAGTVPLFSWFSPTRGDNFASTAPAWSVPLATLRRSGGFIVDGPVREGYTLYRLEGYVSVTPR